MEKVEGSQKVENSAVNTWQDLRRYMWLVLLSTLFSRALASDRNVTFDIRGSGSSLAAPIWQIWAKEFSRRRGGQTSVKYESSTSGRGVEDISTLNDAHTSFVSDFVGSDSLLTSSQYSAFPDLQQLPVLLATVAIIYNIPTVGSGQLVLDVGTAASLFSGNITDWSDPRIAALNPGLSLPKLPVIPVVLGGSSGTTEMLTHFLAQDSTKWKYGMFDDWSDAVLNDLGANNTRVYADTYRTIGEVMATKGALGYAAFPFVVQTNCKFAQLRAADGQLTRPEPPTTYTGNLELNETTFALQLKISPGVYPITDTTYMIFHKFNPYQPCDFQREYLRFLRFVLVDTDARSLAQYFGYILVPSGGDVFDNILKELDSVVCPETGVALLEIQYIIDKKLIWARPILGSIAVCNMGGIVLMIFQILHRFANTSTIRLAGVAFSVSFLCGCLCANLSVLFWCLPPLKDFVCQLRYASALLGISLLMAVMVTKTRSVWIIMKTSERSLSDVKAIPSWNFLRSMSILVCPQVAIVSFWFLTMPVSSTIVLLDPITRQYRQVCTGNTGVIVSLAELVYFTCLTGAGTFYAFKTKGFWKRFDLPNESSNIYNALEKIFICLVFFVPIVLAIEPDTTVYVTVISVAILVPTSFSCYSVMGGKFVLLFQELIDNDRSSSEAKKQASMRPKRPGSQPGRVRNSIMLVPANNTTVRSPSRQSSLDPAGSDYLLLDNNNQKRQEQESCTTTISVRSEDDGKAGESLPVPRRGPGKEKSRSLQVFSNPSNDNEKHTDSFHPQASRSSFTDVSLHEIPSTLTPINSQTPASATPFELGDGPPSMNSNMDDNQHDVVVSASVLPQMFTTAELQARRTRSTHEMFTHHTRSESGRKTSFDSRRGDGARTDSELNFEIA
eukprot:g61832.t1